MRHGPLPRGSPVSPEPPVPRSDALAGDLLRRRRTGRPAPRATGRRRRSPPARARSRPAWPVGGGRRREYDHGGVDHPHRVLSPHRDADVLVARPHLRGRVLPGPRPPSIGTRGGGHPPALTVAYPSDLSGGNGRVR